jgi:hypothetical protein
LLKSHGVPEPVQALVQVLADDVFRARCLCDGQRGDIPPDWWRHVVFWPESGTIFENNTAYFDLQPRRRAMQIEVDRREIDRRWPSPPSPPRGPVPTKDSIKAAARKLIAAGRVPAKTIPWKTFHEELCAELGVQPSERGYSLQTIQAAVSELRRDTQDT